MAIREVFVGGELETVSFPSGSPTSSTTGIDTNFSAAGLSLIGNYRMDFVGEDGLPTSIPVGEIVYIHMYISTGVASSTPAYFTLYDTADRPSIRLTKDASSNLNLQCNTSATAVPAWSTVVSYGGFTSNSPCDVVFDTGVSKALSLFVSNNLAGSGVATIVGADSKYMISGGGVTSNVVSQILVTENKPTIGAVVWTRKASGAGSNSGMAGVFSNLVKTAINDTTALVSNTAGQMSTFTYQDLTTPSGLEWGEVWLWSRAKNDGASPTGLNAVSRVGSTNYQSPPLSGISGGFLSLPARWKVNPATSAKWTDSAFNGAEFGMVSTT